MFARMELLHGLYLKNHRSFRTLKTKKSATIALSREIEALSRKCLITKFNYIKRFHSRNS